MGYIENLNQPSNQIAVRLATYDDLPEIMRIVDAAKELLKADGSSQWQDGYPNKYSFIADIDAESCYVLLVNEVVAATASVFLREETGYSKIHDGAWKYSVQEYGQYAVIHRFAVSADFHGQHIAEKLFREIFNILHERSVQTVRVDTHRKNLRMQHILEKIGMEQRGVITLDHDPVDPTRLAYEGLVENLLGLIE